MYERQGLRLLRGGLDRELPVADVAPSGPAHTSGGRPRPRRRHRQPGRPGASRRGVPRTRRAAVFRRRDVRRLRTHARAIPMSGTKVATEITETTEIDSGLTSVISVTSVAKSGVERSDYEFIGMRIDGRETRLGKDSERSPRGSGTRAARQVRSAPDSHRFQRG